MGIRPCPQAPSHARTAVHGMGLRHATAQTGGNAMKSTLSLPPGRVPRLVTYRPGLAVRHRWAREKRGMMITAQAKPRYREVLIWACGVCTEVLG